jgi:hypothetical protein
VIAVGRCDMAAADLRLQAVLAHQALDLLVVDDQASLPQGRANTPPAIALELVAEDGDRLDDHAVVGRRRRRAVIGRAGDSNQPASFGDG